MSKPSFSANAKTELFEIEMFWLCVNKIYTLLDE